MYRYWDGQAWTTSLSQNPYAREAQGGQRPPKRRRGVAGWIGLAALLVAVVLVGNLIVRTVIGGSIGGQAGSNPTAAVCPTVTPGASSTPIVHEADGRVHGGMLSYPELPPPWSGPRTDHRVPFGTDVSEQIVTIEANYAPDSDWVASILVANLVAGDGFFSPETASEIVVKCIVGSFYGDNKVERTDRVNQAATVDGKPAWLVETHLTFDIPGLQTKGETAIILIVATGETSSSLFYASIPDTVPQFLDDARTAQRELRVGA